MAEQKELAVAHRTVVGKSNKKLRRQGLIPGNITGHNEEPQAIQIEAMAYEALRRSGATTNLIRLTMSNAPTQTALIRHIQHAPTTDQVLHIDFARIGMDERISAKVSLHYVGESPSVKTKGGVLLHLLETLDVECPASNIVDYLEVDISSLAEIDSALLASDVKLPANYILITPPGEFIAKVAATRAEVVPEVAAPTPLKAE